MFSIVIPVYNGSRILARQLPPFLEYLTGKGLQYEIIIVDDGSADAKETQKIAQAHHCLFLRNEHNMGKGAAVRKGMLHAKGQFRLFTDSDIPFEYEAIERFLHYLDFKEFDVVVGDRNLEASTYFTEISAARKWGSSIFTFIVGRFVTTGLFDTQCGLKGFKATVAEDLFNVGKLNGFAFDVELLYISLKRNYDIKRLPVKLREQEESSVSLLKHGPQMLKDLFAMKLNHVKGLYNRRSLK